MTKTSARIPKDQYLTPTKLALEICHRLALLIPSPVRVLEPSAGVGRFVEAAHSVWSDALISGVDIQRKNVLKWTKYPWMARRVFGDWLKTDMAAWKPDLILGNPPYSAKQAHVEHAIEALPDGGHLAFLLPVSFLCTQKRAETLWATPPPFGHLRYVIPLAQRPSFTGEGTDQMEYAVYVWCKGWDSYPQITPHLWVSP